MRPAKESQKGHDLNVALVGIGCQGIKYPLVKCVFLFDNRPMCNKNKKHDSRYQ